MEPNWADRSMFSITVLLAFAILQTMISTQIPSTNEIIWVSVNISSQFAVGALLTMYFLVVNFFSNQKMALKKRGNICGYGISLFRLVDLIVAVICITVTLVVNTLTYQIISSDN